jgi:hypothetical protein
MIAVVRLRYCDRTRTYAARRKRYIAREIYYTLRADFKNLALTT